MFQKRKRVFLFLLGAVLLLQPAVANAYLTQGSGIKTDVEGREMWGNDKDFAYNGYLYRNRLFFEKRPEIPLVIEDTFLWHDEEEQLSVDNVRVSGKQDVEFYWDPPAWYLMAQNISNYYVDGEFVDRLQTRPMHDVIPDESWYVDINK